MKIEGETIQKGVPTPDNPVEIINIFKDLDYAVKIVEGIRNKVTAVNVPENNKEYKIPFLNATESQALTTVLYRLSEYSEEINKLNKRISDLEFALIDMVYQFADDTGKQLNTMGLSALETAFCELDFENPIDKEIVIKKFEELYKEYIREEK